MDLRPLTECYPLVLLAFRAAGVRGHHELARIVTEFLSCHREEEYREHLRARPIKIIDSNTTYLNCKWALDWVLKNAPVNILRKARKRKGVLSLAMRCNEYALHARIAKKRWLLVDDDDAGPLDFKDIVVVTVFADGGKLGKYNYNRWH